MMDQCEMALIHLSFLMMMMMMMMASIVFDSGMRNLSRFYNTKGPMAVLERELLKEYNED